MNKMTMENLRDFSCARHNMDVTCMVIFNPNFDLIKIFLNIYFTHEENKGQQS